MGHPTKAGPEGWRPEGWGPEGWGPKGGAQKFAFFFPSLAANFVLSSLRGLLVELWQRFKDMDGSLGHLASPGGAAWEGSGEGGRGGRGGLPGCSRVVRLILPLLGPVRPLTS